MKQISMMCLGRLCDWRWFRPMQDVPADTMSVAESWLMKRISRMCLGRLCDWRWFRPMQIPVLTVSDLRCGVLDHGSCWQGGVGYIPGVSNASVDVSWRITKMKHQNRIDVKACQEMGFNSNTFNCC